MKTTTLSGIARGLGSSSSRRSFFRLIASAAIPTAVTAAGLPSAGTAERGRKKNKKKCKPACNSESRCVKGTCVPIDRGEEGSNVSVERRRRKRSRTKRQYATRPSDTQLSLSDVRCTKWVLSGGPEATTVIEGVNDLEFTTYTLTEGTGFGYKGRDRIDATHTPVSFEAYAGDWLYIYVDNYQSTCEYPSLWLHCPALGLGRELTNWRTLTDLSDGCPATVTFGIDEQIRV